MPNHASSGKSNWFWRVTSRATFCSSAMVELEPYYFATTAKLKSIANTISSVVVVAILPWSRIRARSCMVGKALKRQSEEQADGTPPATNALLQNRTFVLAPESGREGSINRRWRSTRAPSAIHSARNAVFRSARLTFPFGVCGSDGTNTPHSTEARRIWRAKQTRTGQFVSAMDYCEHSPAGNFRRDYRKATSPLFARGRTQSISLTAEMVPSNSSGASKLMPPPFFRSQRLAAIT